MLGNGMGSIQHRGRARGSIEHEEEPEDGKERKRRHSGGEREIWLFQRTPYETRSFGLRCVKTPHFDGRMVRSEVPTPVPVRQEHRQQQQNHCAERTRKGISR